MPFTNHINEMRELNKQAQNDNVKMHSRDKFPDPNFMPNLVLKYPGKKDKLGDYRLEYYNIQISHSDIIRTISNAMDMGK